LRVAVIGGGIAGLAAAWELRSGARVTVFEPAALGGRIQTSMFEGRLVDCGPDAFLTRVPDAVELCEELGIDDLVAPAEGRTLLWWQGRLRTLPDGLVLGVPKHLVPLATSGLLSPPGVVRAAGDLILPRTPFTGDVTVRGLIARRFGAEVADRLVDPLVGGIHAGRTDALSAESTVPQLVAAARSSRSLLLGLRRMMAAGPGGPIFLAPRQGLAALVDRLSERLAHAGVEFVTAAVSRLDRDGRTWRTAPSGDPYDAVIVATSASESARILGSGAPPGLSDIGAASVVLVTLGYGPVALPEGANGMLVPQQSGWLMTACSFGSTKWSHWAEPGRTVLRVSAGRDGDMRAMELGDDQLVERLSQEVGAALHLSDVPQHWRVSRYPNSFPQYRVGHGGLIRAITDELGKSHPGVVLCGSSYHGAGIPACIASGRSAARSVMRAVTHSEP
jgi:protoporphyrinogen/coproporphyrinogen III oxidase